MSTPLSLKNVGRLSVQLKFLQISSPIPAFQNLQASKKQMAAEIEVDRKVAIIFFLECEIDGSAPPGANVP